jgi:NADH:ubiquinone oxidoreductase subunit E
MDEGSILIASEDEPFGEYLHHQLADLGWPISRTCLVGELLKKVRGEEADLLLLDSSVEGVPSYDLIPLVKKINSSLSIIAFLEDSSLEMSKRLRQERIFFLTMKPIDLTEIRTAVGDAIKMLNQKQKRRNQQMSNVIPMYTQGDLALAQVREICKAHEGKRGDLLIVLQKIQGLFGYVPQPTIDIVARLLGVTTSEIFGVLTFYNRFHLSPRGKHTVRACRGTACHFRGAPSIIDSIRSRLKLSPGKETTEDNLFSLEEVACLGACGIAPVMTIDEETFGNLAPALAQEVIARYEVVEKVEKAAPEAVPEIEKEEKKAA